MDGLLHSYRRERNALLRRSVTLAIIGSLSRDSVDDIQTRDDLAKGGITRRELRVLEDEEELAAIGSWSSISHGQRPARVGGSGEILICVDVTRSTLAPGAGRISTLEGGKSWGIQEAVTRGAIVIILARKKGEGVDRARRSRVELNDDGPSVGDYGCSPCSRRRL